jgi:hypothetical protein
MTELWLPPIALMRAMAFPDINNGSCVPVFDYPLHVGPTEQYGLSSAYHLRARMDEGLMSCGRGWDGDMTVSVSVDQAGSLIEVRVAGGASAGVRRCVERAVASGPPLRTRGPGTIRVGYYMGHRENDRSTAF